MKGSFPLFIVEDINETANYLKKRFSYEIVFESDWYLQLAHGEQQLGLMIENSSNQPKFLHKAFNGVGVVLTIEVADVDKIYDDFKDDNIVHDLVTEEWGQRHFILKAPGGILVDVINYMEPEEYQ